MLPSESPLFLELPLRSARVHDEDAGIAWVEAMPAILGRWPQLTTADYWNLTVAEALAFLKVLDDEKVPDGRP